MSNALVNFFTATRLCSLVSSAELEREGHQNKVRMTLSTQHVIGCAKGIATGTHVHVHTQ